MSKSQRYCATALSRVIRDQGRNQKWLAGKIKVTEATMSRVVNGTSKLDAERAELTAMLLGVPLFLVFELADGSKVDAVEINSERIAS